MPLTPLWAHPKRLMTNGATIARQFAGVPKGTGFLMAKARPGQVRSGSWRRGAAGGGKEERGVWKVWAVQAAEGSGGW